ncbi:unnamed protein product, partial [Rotaria sordida]
AQYLGEELQQNITLTTLDISKNIIAERGAQYLEKLKKKNKTLNVFW